MPEGKPGCLVCHGRGGTRVSSLDGGTRWIKCPECFPRITHEHARFQALHRYVLGNRNELALRNCLRLGYTQDELDTAVNTYDANRRRLFDADQ